MRVLITGAAGFIGSHLADRLFAFAEDNYALGVDNLTTGRAENFAGRLQVIDICDREKLYAAANVFRPSLVIHCAASYSDPQLWHRDIATNVEGTVNVVNVARYHRAKLVYFQTALPPISSYAISKIAGEQYIRLAKDVPSLIFRLANVYGPRNLSGPIPTFYKRLTNGDACTVTDTQRDMVYIEDLVRLVMSAIEKKKTGTYDICSGEHRPIRDLYDAVAAELGVDAKPTEIARPTDDVAQMELNPTRALTDLDWRTFVPLREGVARAVAWYRDHGVGDTYTHLALKG